MFNINGQLLQGVTVQTGKNIEGVAEVQNQKDAYSYFEVRNF